MLDVPELGWYEGFKCCIAVVSSSKIKASGMVSFKDENLNSRTEENEVLTHPHPKYTSMSSSPSAARASSGVKRVAIEDDANMTPAAVEEQASKKDRRPPSMEFLVMESWVRESAVEDNESGCCCHPTERRQIERTTRMQSDHIWLGLDFDFVILLRFS